MSNENVERLRAAYDTFGRRGLAWDLMAADIVFRQPDEMGGGEQIVLWEAYSDRDAALAAAGLEE
jgi:hypothetical protein